MAKDEKSRKRGPKPKYVKLDDDWEDALKKALKEKHPKGWKGKKKEKPDG